MVSVSENFIIQLHNEVCPSWKIKIEQNFPQLFSDVYQIRKMSLYNDYKIQSMGDIKIEHNLIEIPLPNTNEGWTFAAWRLAEAICRTYKGWYPTHFHERCTCRNIILIKL